MAIWDDVLPDLDRQVYEATGWGRGRTAGSMPVLLVIDAMYSFTGDYPMPILESIEKHRTACGADAWRSMEHIAELIEACREQGIPIVYTVMEQRADGFDRQAADRKMPAGITATTDWIGSYANDVPELIAPADEDIVITKPKPSAFYGTPLISYLNYLRADTVILTGCTTSGCVRAAALDASQNNYKVVVPEECVWDRGQLTHKINLFDIHHKMGPVMPNAEVIDYVRGLPPQPFGARTPTKRMPDQSMLPTIDRPPVDQGAVR